MNAERQPIAERLDVIEKLIEILGLVAHDMQHRAEDLAVEIGDTSQFRKYAARHKGPAKAHAPELRRHK